MARVVAFVPDLMDRSRLTAAGLDVAFVAAVHELPAAASGAELVVVDLGRPGVLEAVEAIAAGGAGAPVVGFASHVEGELLAAAEAAGCREVLPRSRFFRRLSDLLA